MTRKLISTVVIAIVFLLPVNSFSAGAAGVQHIQSIYSDDKGNALSAPEGVACDNNAVLIVADSGNGRLLRYIYKDSSVETAPEIRVPQLPYPIVVRLNSKGDIFALNGRDGRIVHLGPEGKFIGYLSPSGLPSPSSFTPRSFAIDRDDNIYILDIFNGRVLILTPEGSFSKAVKLPASRGFFSDVTVDFKGNVLIIDSINARVFSAAKDAAVFSQLTEGMKEQMRFPTGITTDNRGRIYLVDRNGSRVIVIGQDGSFIGRISERGWKEGLLNYPSQMCISDNGNVFIADTSSNRVQIFMLVK